MSGSTRRTAARAALVALAVVAGLALGPAPVARAHGVLRASDPGAGAVVDQSPATITLSFTEAPELPFSSVKVLDGTGRSFGAGELQPVAGDPETLSQPLQTLPKGVYTVSWRIVSRVDGHLTAGSFAFGVQTPVTADAAAAAAEGASLPGNRSVAAVGGRALLYAGLACLLGAGVGRRPPVPRAAPGAGGAAGGGMGGRGRRVCSPWAWPSAARRARRWTSSSSPTWAGRCCGGWSGSLVAAGGVALAVGWRRWRPGLALVAAGTLGTIVAHVESGHAAAASPAWLAIGLQVGHVVAMAVWLGGLAALLAGLGRAARTRRRSPRPGRSRRWRSGPSAPSR